MPWLNDLPGHQQHHCLLCRTKSLPYMIKYFNRKHQDYVYVRAEYQSTFQKIKSRAPSRWQDMKENVNIFVFPQNTSACNELTSLPWQPLQPFSMMPVYWTWSIKWDRAITMNNSSCCQATQLLVSPTRCHSSAGGVKEDFSGNHLISSDMDISWLTHWDPGAISVVVNIY